MIKSFKMFMFFLLYIVAFFISSCEAERKIKVRQNVNILQDECCDNVHNCINETIVRQLEHINVVRWMPWNVEWSGKKAFVAYISQIEYPKNVDDDIEVAIFEDGSVYSGKGNLGMSECHKKRISYIYKKVEKEGFE